MFPAAHASDGGGSIRIPASCCGLVGLKPSRGRVASTVPGWQGMSTQGALTRTVADAAAILDVISAPDPYAWWNAPRPDRPFLAEVGADPAPCGWRCARCPPWACRSPPSRRPRRTWPARLLEAAGHHVSRLEADIFDPVALAPVPPRGQCRTG